MVAYNFAPRFADLIRTGKKTHTVRRNGKRRHARHGESLQLYTGMRTKSCRKILDHDPECIGVLRIEIWVTRDAIERIAIEGHEFAAETFAVHDGFESLSEMHAFFLGMHGPGKFLGTLIEWEHPQAKR